MCGSRVLLLPCLCVLTLAAGVSAHAAPKKQHVIALGKWTSVAWNVGAAEDQPLTLKVRALYVDDRVREFTTGEPHDVTARLFVVRRAFRLNDQLPGDHDKKPRWRWERGGWFLVDRFSGRITSLNLPLFDAFHTSAAWFRDYAGYCGISEDGAKLYAMVAQLGRKKAIVKQEIGPALQAEVPDAQCDAPEWQRAPVRVTFRPHAGQSVTFTVRGHVADLLSEAED
jgi:hypothetical protein